MELDCWDGEDGEPEIYHGHTLTSHIKVEDEINALRDWGFKNSSGPVILSFENHCGLEQQARMAHHCRTILGDLLFVPELRNDGMMP